jgi:hypothetical protein
LAGPDQKADALSRWIPSEMAASIEPLVVSIKEQTTKFKESLDTWVQQQQKDGEDVHKNHRETMMLAEGMLLRNFVF